VNAPRHLRPTGLSGGGGGLVVARLDSKEDSKRKLVFKFQMNLGFGKTWRNFTRGLRRNLDMGIFPKFF
jgi:hypothetical protein